MKKILIYVVLVLVAVFLFSVYYVNKDDKVYDKADVVDNDLTSEINDVVTVKKEMNETLDVNESDETNAAVVFLEQIKEIYSVSGPIIPGEVVRGVSGHKINLEDLVGIEIEKYLLQNFSQDKRSMFVTQSNDGLFHYKDEVFCMNFGRTTSNNGPFIWCTNNKDIIK